MIIFKLASGDIKTFVNRGRGGTFWLALKSSTNDQVLETKLIGLGYRRFRGAFTKQILPNNLDQVKTELQQICSEFSITCDFSALDKISSEISQINAINPEQNREEGSEVNSEANSFISKMRKELATTSSHGQSDTLIKMIDDELENLAAEVDEAKKKDFINRFLEFASKFWSYSLSNQMLIFFQTEGKSTYVKGRKQWEELGRKVKEEEITKGISILAPVKKNLEIDDSVIKDTKAYVSWYNSSNREHDLLKPDNIKKFLGISKGRGHWKSHNYLVSLLREKKFNNTDDVLRHLEQKENDGNDKVGGGMFFKPVLVYDITQTDPIPGQNAWEPISNDVWQSKNNDDEEKASTIRDAALEYAEELGLDVNMYAETGNAGGFSTETGIEINYKSKGQRQLSTVLHEIAHSILHWRNNEIKNTTRKEREIDAESVSYICMKHFGYTAEYAPNYLALHGASSEEVRKRRESIARAVKEIITAVRKNLVEEKKLQSCVSINWYKKSKVNWNNL
jgi:hypothetical protein